MADRKKPTSRYLEYIAGFASTVSSSQTETDMLIFRLYRYYQQSLARELLPNEKVAKCARVIRPNKQVVEVVFVPETKKAYFRNLIICGRVWTCAVCAAKVNERRRKELALLVYSSGFRPVLVTYTVQHQRKDRLGDLVGALQAGLRFCKGGREYQTQQDRYGIVGSVRGFEVTHGRSGWHPHIHELLLMRGDVTDTQVVEFETWLRLRWQVALQKTGHTAGLELGVKVTFHNVEIAEYVAKFGRERAGDGWTITHEVVKSNTKGGKQDGRTPFELLLGYGDKNLADGRKFQEYARVMKNIHPLHWSAGLRALLNSKLPEQSDDEAASDDPEVYEVFARLEPDAWKIVLTKERRGELIAVTSTGDKSAVQRWLAKIGVQHVDLSQF